MHAQNPAQEEQVLRVFEQHRLLYPVPISEATHRPLVGFPWIRPADFMRAMNRYGDLGHILGGCANLPEAGGMLRTFWTRYEQVCPSFGLFDQIRRGEKQMEQCVPLYLHGDEGVTYKKGGVLVMSFQSPLGYGTSRRAHSLSLNLQNLGESGLPLNFLESGMYTRMLMVICQKEGGSEVLCSLLCINTNMLYIYSCINIYMIHVAIEPWSQIHDIYLHAKRSCTGPLQRRPADLECLVRVGCGRLC